MKIRFSEKRLKIHLKMAVFFVGIGIILVLLSIIIELWNEVSFSSIGIGQIFTGITFFIVHYFENKKQYLTLKNGELIKNTLIPKKIRLNEIEYIQEFAGDLKLFSKKEEFIIDTQIIDPISLLELKEELKNYAL